MQTFAGEVMVSVAWDSEGILLVNFVERCVTINLELYMQVLQKLKASAKEEDESSPLPA